ncbi:putative methyltransferase-like protein [Neolecta irregularis DAH-3]|uniref:Putative methyltransferase-like protein n=1 Tax=Neolecta irregularis (strain DAH-3) TaxID=1198029 RepID=A0A1U7LRZ9_NEOID|nr:putative methyltransferase-like protein [Neolecta irregularis DAH-3]|eukprot:OLL25322.1 putative methyltransferase-like protein [Neolecta irregularis DAH-3]
MDCGAESVVECEPGRLTIDFNNPKALVELTRCLMKRDFGVDLEIPQDRLCPPVPGRLDYILWIQDLVDSTDPSTDDFDYDLERDVSGLDIGAGSTCIYPILACKTRPKWKVYGTDIDEKSYNYAVANVERNHLESQIKLLFTLKETSLFPLLEFKIDRLDFTMCNPPFYESVEEMLQSAREKSYPAFSSCTGSESEMITPGGEAAFVARMIEESKAVRDKIQWFTSILGKLSSLTIIVEKLKEENISNYALGTVMQGNRTKRWVVAWSFSDRRPSNIIVHPPVGSLSSLLPPSTEFKISCPKGFTKQTWINTINLIIRRNQLQWTWSSHHLEGCAEIFGNTWSRAARRSASRGVSVTAAKEPVMRVKIKIQFNILDDTSTIFTKWLQGTEPLLFQSFCGMLKRAIHTEK